MNLPPKSWLLALAICAAIALFAFRAPLGLVSTDRQSSNDKAAPVTVAIAITKDMPVYAQAIGTVLANATVQVKSRIDGQILRTGFQEGQLVKKGDLLFEIDRAPYEAAVRAARANLQRDEAQLANASRELNRANELSKKGYVSTQTKDAAATGMKSLTASVAAGQAALDQAELQLSYTEIRSPIDGKTGPILVDAGNIIKANDTGALVVVTQVQPVRISFALPQQNLPMLQRQLREKTLVAALRLPMNDKDKPDETPIAKVDYIANSVNTASGTIELRATYDNPDLRFVPGEYVDVSVRLDELKQVVTLPRVAVNTGQQGLYVFVVNDEQRAEMRSVTLLHEDAGIAAVNGEIKAGERIVVNGQLRLINGSLVKIMGDSTEQPTS
tara:strand:- start:28697 stop:29854 length:1158 start_codon:yes stop_codon:yes gene_type:complete